jgi:uncharacterized repeat protein (TIGR03803 family)
MQSRKISMILVVTLVACLAGLARRARAADNARVLYAFTGPDGASPKSDLIFDAHGNLYGTTYAGGAYNLGTVFELSPGPDGKWSATVLHSFQQDGKDGIYPQSGVIFDKAGNLYGTTFSGGPTGGGTLFELSPGPNGTWSETLLHVFTTFGFADDGLIPGDLIMDKAGDIYGTTMMGGGRGSIGTIFRLARTANGAWSYAKVYSFSSKGGGFGVSAGLVLDAAGNLYGGSEELPGNGGVVFKLTRGSNGAWTETVLHIFQKPGLTDMYGHSLGGADGYGGKSLAIDKAGNLYGTTTVGGDCSTGTCSGIAYELTQGSNGTWSQTVLHNFNSFRTHNYAGDGPQGRLVIDAAGNLYGTTPTGGVGLGGTVFKLTPNADGAWTETVLYAFDTVTGGYPERGTHGDLPLDGVIFDKAGNLYGTASTAGTQFGTVFEILPGSDPVVSSNVPSATSPTSSGSRNPASSSSAALQGTSSLADDWQSDAYSGQTFHFKFDGSAIYVYGSQQELLGTLQQKGKNGVIDMYEGLVQIPPLTQCPEGRGLMQIKTWNENQLDARIETPMNTSNGVTCGGLLGTGRMVRWQQVTFVKR